MSTATPSAQAALTLLPSDLRGLCALGADGCIGVTDLVEAMHGTIAARAGFGRAAAAQRTTGLTRVVYGAVRGSMRLVAGGIDAGWRGIEPALPRPAASAQRDAFVAALNGLWGDHLAARGNPLAISMALRRDGVALALQRAALARQIPAAGGKLLVLVHGLCMSDRQWTRDGHDHGRMLAQTLGYTPLYLHYNSGLHVSDNGREFAAQLQQLLAAWPVPVDELVIVGHSMGGLVARSACHQAQAQGMDWLHSLRALVCLGTPHHGAPLERGGRRLDQLLSLSPYVAPFAKLGKARSAGITDLRFGNLQDADWQGRDRHAQRHDDRRATPLPEGVATYLLAATTADKPGLLHRALIGDGLVPLASALGEHRQPALALQVPRGHRHVVASCGHLDLLCHEAVRSQLLRWLGGAPAAA